MSRFFDAFEHLRNDVPSSLNAYEIVVTNVFSCHLFSVVQSGAAHGDTTQLHRTHERNGSHNAGTPNTGHDLDDARDFLAGRELERKRPTRVVVRNAKLFSCR